MAMFLRLFFLTFFIIPAQPTVAQEKENGLLPVPQKGNFSAEKFSLNDQWSISVTNVGKNDIALRSLHDGLKERNSIRLSSANTANRIQLIIKDGAVNIGATTDTNRASLVKQAYHLKIQKGKITITANAPQGLFYGVQTFLQSLYLQAGQTFANAGEITDWPDMDMRIIYWDDAHHLERIEALKRAIRQAAFYKINGFAIKLEGHFQYASAKPIVEPYAYTAVEYQELTDYARSYYVELIPYLDAPAHVSFILKHPEFAHLRAFANSNYEISVVDPKADALLLGMFNELIEANKGGKYILMSTDEAYYTGKPENEKRAAEKAGGEGRLLAHYISRIANKLHEKGRKVIIWAEFPLKEEDINYLPSHIINGVYNDEWAATIRSHGMRQLIYTSTQGVEPLFPNYTKQAVKEIKREGTLALTDDEAQQGELALGRVGEVLNTITTAVAAKKADLMGVIVAAWADTGLHPETFWLGYAAGAAGGWNHNKVSAADLSKRFYSSFYGADAHKMDSIYSLLSSQADFWDKSWDWQASQWRTPIFGNSYKIFDTAKPAKDQTIPLPAVPSASNLSIQKDWLKENNERLALAKKFLEENDRLMQLLYEAMENSHYQFNNLQVLHSVR